MQDISPQSMVYLTVTGTTSDGHNQLAFHSCQFFSEHETTEIRDAVFVLNRYFTNLDRLDGVRDAYHEFKSELKNLDKSNPRSKVTVDRRFRAFILEWKLFLDHFGRFIETGAHTAEWKEASKEQKDQYLSAFMRYYKDIINPATQTDAFNLAAVIRNHIQHAFDAVDYTNWEKVFINRNKILNGPRVSASQRKALNKQPELIDLEVIADIGMQVIDEIHEKLLCFMVDEETASASLTLLKAQNRILEKGIQSDRWMICGMSEFQLIDRKTGKTMTEIQEENGDFSPFDLLTGKLNPDFSIGTKMVYIPLNWPAYIAFAGFLGKMWQKGTWKEIQSKYL